MAVNLGNDVFVLIVPIETSPPVLGIFEPDIQSNEELLKSIIKEIDNVSREIIPDYALRLLSHSNVCGENTEKICKKLMKKKEYEGKVKKIIIGDWPGWPEINHTQENQIKKEREAVFGKVGTTMFTSYHALPYINFDKFVLAIETTICTQYPLQFHIATSDEQLEKIIKQRYYVQSYKLVDDIDIYWSNVLYPPEAAAAGGGSKGGARRKTKKCKYKTTAKDRKYLKMYKQGKSIGFTMRSSLKAKGLIPRASGKKIISDKYCF